MLIKSSQHLSHDLHQTNEFCKACNTPNILTSVGRVMENNSTIVFMFSHFIAFFFFPLLESWLAPWRVHSHHVVWIERTLRSNLILIWTVKPHELHPEVKQLLNLWCWFNQTFSLATLALMSLWLTDSEAHSLTWDKLECLSAFYVQ